MGRHRWTLAEYDELHERAGMGEWWMASKRRVETAAEIEAGVGPGELADEVPTDDPPVVG